MKEHIVKWKKAVQSLCGEYTPEAAVRELDAAAKEGNHTLRRELEMYAVVKKAKQQEEARKKREREAAEGTTCALIHIWCELYDE